MLRFMRDEYDDPPLLITENGCADAVGEEALVDDARIRYCNDHIRTVELGSLLIVSFHPVRKLSILM
uniref:Uncharacterized protein n=1 Tax=Parascaris equorum TaxID=6256 RepID=A0A914SAP3_PAREQ